MTLKHCRGVAVTLCALACGSEVTGPVAGSIAIAPDAGLLAAIGETLRLAVTVYDVDGNELDADVSWTTSASSVATVDLEGLVVARGNGSAVIRAESAGLSDSATITVAQAPAGVAVIGVPGTLHSIGAQATLTAEVRDAGGTVIPGESVIWTSLDQGIVDVTAGGVAQAVANGTARLVAFADALSDTALVTVDQRVHAITVSSSTDYVLADDTVRFTAEPVDSLGNPVAGVVPQWSSGDDALATVDGTGLVSGHVVGSTTLTVTAANVVGQVPLRVVVWFRSVAAGLFRTCAVTTTGTAYCWGNNSGTLGAGAGLPEPMAIPVRVVHPGVLETVASGEPAFSCGIDDGGVAWCWGSNISGGIGVPSTNALVPFPVQIQSGATFEAIDAGSGFACAHAADGTAECWGTNNRGELGNGTSNTGSALPGSVLGGLDLARVRTGYSGSACGLDASGAAYCWGTNQWGALGDTLVVGDTARPVPVSGSLSFSDLDVGGAFACAVETPSGTVYCWGIGDGRLGDGTTAQRGYPAPVSGGQTYTMVTTGLEHACALTATGDAYCWGNNGGALGDGTTAASTVPIAVSGGLQFKSLSAGGAMTCGISTADILYCWGINVEGELGDGTLVNRTVPTRVLFQP